MADLVSVIIPAYNGSAFLDEALESVFAQTLAPCEVIVVDDASTDGTWDLLTAAARRAPVRLRLIRLPKNSGSPARPINVALKAASGEYVAICDQDDVFCPEKLQDQVAIFEQHPEIACVASLAGRVGHPEELFQPDALIKEVENLGEAKNGFIQLPGPLIRKLFIKYGNFIMGYPGFLFRREDWQRKGGVNERFRIASDMDFLYWLSTRGPLALIERVHYLRRWHGGNLTRHSQFNPIEVTLLKGLCAAREPRLLAESGLSEELREDLYSMGFKSRAMGLYARAFLCHWVSLRLWGPEVRTLKALGKLLPHWLCRKWLVPKSSTQVRRGT